MSSSSAVVCYMWMVLDAYNGVSAGGTDAPSGAWARRDRRAASEPVRTWATRMARGFQPGQEGARCPAWAASAPSAAPRTTRRSWAAAGASTLEYCRRCTSARFRRRRRPLRDRRVRSRPRRRAGRWPTTTTRACWRRGRRRRTRSSDTRRRARARRAAAPRVARGARRSLSRRVALQPDGTQPRRVRALRAGDEAGALGGGLRDSISRKIRVLKLSHDPSRRTSPRCLAATARW